MYSYGLTSYLASHLSQNKGLHLPIKSWSLHYTAEILRHINPCQSLSLNETQFVICLLLSVDTGLWERVKG